ncbi:hypothetical protein BGW36DRAFT_152717 [Talaromyces proteolyticus]|uniref:Allergen Asp f 4 n=1 Tax=Talaromyces proteolyticus TaxID=1131652 RepID=A0AAD4KXD4_9EURO|nr:uncharacterized protein BGW36DRAFT_152717 [Talaromyces proteolyticus]KAH8698917.1 hypothetical protein BGW36DRAFT_152717 [Talaromyces proteolyticus]
MLLKACFAALIASTASAHTHGHGHERRHQDIQPSSSSTVGPAPLPTDKPQFGGVTPPTGSDISYCGNHGNPYGSNILVIDEKWVPDFDYVTRMTLPASTTESWNVVVWNKCGTDGGLNGDFGEWVQNFTIQPGETKYIAFDVDTAGGWCASPGDKVILNEWGSCSSTWGEFEFAHASTKASGFDVSVIQAQNAHFTVQGMNICATGTDTCSSITNSGVVNNAYTAAEAYNPSLGGHLNPGKVTLDCTLNYSG